MKELMSPIVAMIGLLTILGIAGGLDRGTIDFAHAAVAMACVAGGMAMWMIRAEKPERKEEKHERERNGGKGSIPTDRIEYPDDGSGEKKDRR